jgi:hypothetical protein
VRDLQVFAQRIQRDRRAHEVRQAHDHFLDDPHILDIFQISQVTQNNPGAILSAPSPGFSFRLQQEGFREPAVYQQILNCGSFRSEEGFGFGPISGYGVDTIIGLPPIYAVPAGCHFGCGKQEKRLRRLAVKYLQFLFNKEIMDALYLSANLKSSYILVSKDSYLFVGKYKKR